MVPLYFPQPMLKKYISYYWVNQHDGENVFDDQTPKIPPYGAANLMLNFGSEYEYINAENVFKVHSHFKGPHMEYYKIKHVGKIDLLGVAFKPYGLYPFTGYPIYELSNRVLALEEVDENFFKIQEKLITLSSIEERIFRLEYELIKLISSKRTEIDDIIYATEVICYNRGIIKVDDVALEINVSKKTLERKFRNIIGLTPKNYIRLLRFNCSLKEVRNDKSDENWIDIAIKCGYYDQSHFVSEFKEFMGNSPEKYLTKKDLIGDFYSSE